MQALLFKWREVMTRNTSVFAGYDIKYQDLKLPWNRAHVPYTQKRLVRLLSDIKPRNNVQLLVHCCWSWAFSILSFVRPLVNFWWGYLITVSSTFIYEKMYKNLFLSTKYQNFKKTRYWPTPVLWHQNTLYLNKKDANTQIPKTAGQAWWLKVNTFFKGISLLLAITTNYVCVCSKLSHSDHFL